MNRFGFEVLIDGDLEWLAKQPRTLEREHVEVCLKALPDVLYGRDKAKAHDPYPGLDVPTSAPSAKPIEDPPPLPERPRNRHTRDAIDLHDAIDAAEWHRTDAARLRARAEELDERLMGTQYDLCASEERAEKAEAHIAELESRCGAGAKNLDARWRDAFGSLFAPVADWDGLADVFMLLADSYVADENMQMALLCEKIANGVLLKKASECPA